MTSGYYQMDQEPSAARRRSIHPALSGDRPFKAPAQLRQPASTALSVRRSRPLGDNPVVPQRCWAGSLAEERAQLHLAVEKVPLEQLLKIWNNTSGNTSCLFVPHGHRRRSPPVGSAASRASPISRSRSIRRHGAKCSAA